MTIDILPDSRTRVIVTPKGSKFGNGLWWQPIYCMNCGKPGGMVPEGTPVSYLCDDPCAQKWGKAANEAFMPDEVFYRLVADACQDAFGRQLELSEVELQLQDPESLVSTLARSRKSLTPNAGG